ncbi:MULTISPECIES: Rieske (2Fe-2S) protein [unclassified Streptomyces]|uniref:QcrA and Rieske domain-containing protein n=1 Tax=unclassified Streptomyces TaxID=2593676 RepID=UPI002E0D9F8A|nr:MULTISPECIES: Rieske (2Fe-2S) protein [unclassified Streptomyces]WSR26440.1 Rieske (2Fe-2S) protein [Streptomyces sp. NBC_01205]
MSLTEPPPPVAGPDLAGEDAAERLRDRISADSLTTRRDYLRIVATVSGGLAIGGAGVASGILHRHGDSEALPRTKKVTDHLAPGESVAFRFPGDEDRALAVRLADNSLVGYSAVCTHLACAVLWRADRGADGELYCPCHEGVFDARTGEVTAGPPPRPLPRIFLTEESDGSVWAVATARSGEPAREALCRQFAKSRPEMARGFGCLGVDRSTESRRT